MTQPSLSMQIKSGRKNWAWCCSIAARNRVIPTEAGEVVLAEIRETLRAYDHIREAVAEPAKETSGLMVLRRHSDHRTLPVA